jgi:hypothetical protein
MDAKVIPRAIALVPDRLFDRLVLSAIKSAAKKNK